MPFVVLSFEMPCFLAVMRCPCKIVCFLLHNYRTRCLSPLRALRMRFHAFGAVMRFLDEISCIFGCDVRTVERCMLKDVGDWYILFEQVG